ncbi:MAG: UbiX family flavin prenyltransferase [Candidatus Micrarchaeia archaeon]|jgi:4-hydroxy-3-polyprenylbenzoate decarboxylase
MRIVVAISGASGTTYGVRLVEALKRLGHTVFVVISGPARKVAKYEGVKLPKADFKESEIDAPFASGSNSPDVMIIAPCSLKTLGNVANGTGSGLIDRAAEVMLKERKKLILLVRETPLSLVAIENMAKASLAGAIIMPAAPGFYAKHKDVSQLVDFMVGKVLDQAGVKHNLYKRWRGK